jgi:outer membrane receptor protein involved in Fe transport
MFSSRIAIAVAATAGIWSSSAAAQETPPAGGQPAEASPAPGQPADDSTTPSNAPDIVITGSRIARRDLTSDSPIVTIGKDDITSRGVPTLEGTLNQLPQFTPSSGAASGFNTRGGQANLNLRALGTARTLVLIDGRRLQPSNSDGSADINVLPQSIIEGVETITGGASAVYGSDAVAGVVNIKLRRRFKGLEIDGQSTVSDKGDAGTRDISVTAGTDFAGGRGNIFAAGSYSQRDMVLFRDRSFLTVQGLNGMTVNGTISSSASNLPSQAAVNTIFARYGAAPGSVSRSSAFSFNSDGTLFLPSPAIGYKGSTTDPYLLYQGSIYDNSGLLNQAQLPLERYSGFGRAEFNVGGSTTLFAQALYTHYAALTQSQGASSSLTVNPLTVPVTNPFFPADLAALAASRPNPTAPYTIQKRFSALGPRTERDTYDFYQATIGADGKVGLGDLRWNAYATIGETRYVANEVNYPSTSAVQRLLSAPDGGASLCTGGYNPFGNQPISASCAAYIARDSTSTTTLRQTVAEASVTGSLFQLSGKDVGFAVGADYRRTSYSFTPDPLIAAGDLINYLPTAASKGYDSAKEVYGELLVPILHDVPFFQSLNIDLGARYSGYRISGGVTTFKADADWKPIDQLMFRGGYARAIRAPSVGDLFSALTSDSVALGGITSYPNGDPCDYRSGFRTGATATNAAAVRTLCLSQGVPANIIDTYMNNTSRQATATAGNLALKPETANTYSVGAVFRATGAGLLFSRFSLSVDYYNIKVKDAIGNITGIVAVQSCFNANGLNPTLSATNTFCQLISRNTTTGEIGLITTPRLNLGGYKTSGIDISANWPIPLSALGISNSGTLTLSTDVNYLDKFEIQTLPGGVFLDYAGTIQNTQVDLFSSARPRWKAVSSARYSSAAFSLGFRWRFIGSMANSANVGVVNGVLPVTKRVDYFDLDGSIKVADGFQLRAGVTNLLDRQPPVTGATPVGARTIDADTYDLIGRRFFVGFQAKF